MPKLVLITGPDLRHRYFVNRLNREFTVENVFIEQISYPESSSPTPGEQAAWNWFFHRRDEYEQSNYSESEEWPTKNIPRIISIPAGSLNSAETLNALQAINPDLIILFGTSLVGEAILNSFPDKILNLHLGISGTYRGSSCNFWPIHDGRLDCLGATLMKVNSGIDTGEILTQKNIPLVQEDNEQTLMGKTLILGADMTLQVLHQTLPQYGNSSGLASNGKLFLKNDFKPEAVARVREMVASGRLADLIKQFVKTNRQIT